MSKRSRSSEPRNKRPSSLESGSSDLSAPAISIVGGNFAADELYKLVKYDPNIKYDIITGNEPDSILNISPNELSLNLHNNLNDTIVSKGNNNKSSANEGAYDEEFIEEPDNSLNLLIVREFISKSLGGLLEKFGLTGESAEVFIDNTAHQFIAYARQHAASSNSSELLKISELPTEAPLLWTPIRRGRPPKGEPAHQGTSPIDFIMEVYGPWMGKGFSLKLLRDLDPKLANAYRNFRMNHPDVPLPEGFDLPTKKEVLDREIESLTDSTTGRVPVGDFTYREARRLQAAAKRRQTEK
jgi:hypothetical protein